MSLRGVMLAVGRLALTALMLVAVLPAAAQSVSQDDEPAEGLTIAEIRFSGLDRTGEQEVRNNIRSAVGQPYRSETVRLDLRRLEALGRFDNIRADRTVSEAGTVVLTYVFDEQQPIREIQVVGNSVITDQELRGVIGIFTPTVLESFRIQNAVRRVEALYRERGYYLAQVTYNRDEIEDSEVLIFTINEGPRVRIRAIEFRTVRAFQTKQVQKEIKTKTAAFLFRKGQLDRDVLSEDVNAIIAFYRDRGYLDVRVDYTIEISPDSTEAKVVFLIEEGEPYTMRELVVRPRTADGAPAELKVFAIEQLAAMLEIKPGDVYSMDKIRKSIRVVRDAYLVLGYVDVDIRRRDRRVGQSEVDLELTISEGGQFKTGIVDIQGNFLTKDKVIRRQLGLTPGRPIDGRQISGSIDKIQRTRLLREPRITIQDYDPDNPEYRDILVEVKEQNTGSINFGLAVGSDTGAFGTFEVQQRNFDIADLPKTFEEAIRGRAFRGAGQRFNLLLAPGNEVSQFRVSLTEPYLFETNTSLRVGGLLRDREFRDFDEDRRNFSLSLGRRFGEVWDIGVSTRFERVELSDIDDDAPVDVFEAAGPDTFNAFGVSLTRTTIGTIRRPGKGSRLEIGFEQFGLLGGEFDFSKVQGSYTVFMTVDEDFLGRISTLRFDTKAGYIFNGDAPTYERFYLGGRTFRGFEFREVSPKGIRNDNGELGDDPVGGDWMFFLGAQYQFPLLDEFIDGVAFVDSGTVTNDVGFDDYRVSIGAGVRLFIPLFGQAPVAIDFAVPLVDQEGDRDQLISFDLELPFD